MKPSKYLLLAFFLMTTKPGHTQTPVDSSIFQYNRVIIDASLLIGFWESTDPLKTRIEFVDLKFEVVIKHDSTYSYSFMKDSLQKVSASGFIANWPPYDCTLNMIAPDTLEIIHSQMGTVTGRKNYVRVK